MIFFKHIIKILKFLINDPILIIKDFFDYSPKNFGRYKWKGNEK